MLVIVFSHERETMLKALLCELDEFEVVVIDDGSEFSKDWGEYLENPLTLVTKIRTQHTGKRGFWRKWVVARQLALGSEHEHFLFLPDDVSNLNLEAIKAINRQGWEKHFFAVNVINCGRSECWGRFSVGQEPFEIGGVDLFEVGFVDCGFLTNRHTLEHIEITPPQKGWFDRPDKSSGVGYGLSTSLRLIGASMLMAKQGLCFHGDHASVMHTKHRQDVPLISKS